MGKQSASPCDTLTEQYQALLDVSEAIAAHRDLSELFRDLAKRLHRVVLFDQRGSGQSTPHACLEENTTWHLVSDIERLREHLGLDRWLVFGGSWGSTLALAYAETCPQRVTELVLRGIFLVRKWEIDWFYQNPGGAAALYPDLWEEYVSTIPQEERSDMVRAYYKRLTSEDPRVLRQAAKAWSVWEGATSFLHLNPEYIEKFAEDEYAAAFARAYNGSGQVAKYAADIRSGFDEARAVLGSSPDPSERVPEVPLDTGRECVDRHRGVGEQEGQA